ncbi:MAG TPA: rRNA maturation RNase YbeY [Buchnera sp. (in: enterobacteria)]|nr:rRNA maturation RNase YbeY [Buchnera sp. (in: enterobacteria)]
MNNIILNIQKPREHLLHIPKKKYFIKWLTEVLKNQNENNEITIRIVDKIEIQTLNFKYRGKNKPTNILSFSYLNTYINKTHQLGDLIICYEILIQEAKIQKKDILSYWAHMIIHGTLHLLGYDHDNNIQRKKMEFLETDIMIKLGYSDPYSYEKNI